MQLLSALGQSRTQGNHIEYKRPLLQLLSLCQLASSRERGREGTIKQICKKVTEINCLLGTVKCVSVDSTARKTTV